MTSTTNSNRIKVLTIHQPYASYLVFGLKQYETCRQFINYRGQIYIHAAKNKFGKNEKLKATAVLNTNIKDPNLRAEAILSLSFSGVIFGVATIADCLYTVSKKTDPAPKNRSKIVITEISNFERELGYWSKNQYVYRVENQSKLISPIPIDGKQGLWSPPDSLIADIRNATPSSHHDNRKLHV